MEILRGDRLRRVLQTEQRMPFATAPLATPSAVATVAAASATATQEPAAARVEVRAPAPAVSSGRHFQRLQRRGAARIVRASLRRSQSADRLSPTSMAAIPRVPKSPCASGSQRRAQRLSLVLALAMLTSSTLRAQGAATARSASEHFERGYQLAQEGKLEAAIDEFNQAYALKPHPLVLYNLGQAYAASGRAVEAVAALKRYLAEAGPADAHRAQATAMLEHQAQRVGELQLEVSPAGAELSVDGIPVGVAPLTSPLELTAGPHGVLARLNGHEAHAEAVYITGKQRSRLTVALHASPAPEPRRAPAVPRPDPATQRALLSLRTEREQRRRSQTVASLATGGLGVASLVVAGVIFARNQAAYDDWNQRSQNFAARLGTATAPTRQELDQLLARENTLRNRDAWALGLGVLGGVLSAASAALWLSLPGDDEQRVSIQLGPNRWLGYSTNF